MAIGPITTLHSPIYLTNNNANVSITRAVSLPDYVGQVVCQDGAWSYDDLNGTVPCGNYQGVSSYTVSASGQAFRLDPALWVVLFLHDGDSGAPLVNTDVNNGQPSTTFYGLLSGGIGSGSGSDEFFSETGRINVQFEASFQYN